LMAQPIIIEFHIKGYESGTHWATAQIYLSELLERSGRMHASVDFLTSSELDGTAQVIGKLTFKAGLDSPIMDVAEQFRKMRKPAMQQLISRTGGSRQKASDPGNAKTKFEVNIVSARGLPLVDDQRPSPIAYYQFYNFPPCETATVHSSCDPAFNDRRTYEVYHDSRFITYLKGSDLDIMIFDDSSMGEGSIGTAAVPLKDLQHMQELDQEYPLTDEEGKPCGTIHLRIRWANMQQVMQEVRTNIPAVQIQPGAAHSREDRGSPMRGRGQTWAHEAEVNDIAEFGGTQQGLGRGSGAGHAHFSPAASAGTRRSTVGSSQNWGDSRLELGMSGRSFGGSRAELDVTGRSFGGSRAELDITGNASEWGMSTRGDMEDTLSPGNEMRLPEFGRPGHSRGFGT